MTSFIFNLALFLAAILAVLLVLGRIRLRRARKQKVYKTMIVLGSGGHTSEMMRFLRTLDFKRHNPRVYVVANTDKHSAQIATNFELHMVSHASMVESFTVTEIPYTIKFIPRSREVGQSYVTSVFSTLRSLWSSLFLMLTERPDLVLSNGPGTCVPICLLGVAMKMFGFHPTRVVLLESYACVQHLSATAKILNRFIDFFGVQWPQLLTICSRAKYTGRLLTTAADFEGLRRSPRKMRKSLPVKKEATNYALVAVGSTKFEQLIQTIDSPAFVAKLRKLGISGLRIQKGTGTYIPKNLVSTPDFAVAVFDFTQTWAAEVAGAGLVIGHAGAGTILDTLEAHKPLIVVPNGLLMSNHQLDIANELAKQEFLFVSSCEKLIADLDTIKLAGIKDFPPTESTLFRDHLYALLE